MTLRENYFSVAMRTSLAYDDVTLIPVMTGTGDDDLAMMTAMI